MFNMDHCGEKNAGWELRTAGAVQENGPGKRRPGDKEQGQGAEKKGQKADTIGEQIGKSTLSLCVFAKGFRQGFSPRVNFDQTNARLVRAIGPFYDAGRFEAQAVDAKGRFNAESSLGPAWAQPGR